MLDPLVPGVVTLTWIVQVVAPVPSAPPASENELAPGFAVTVNRGPPVPLGR